MIPIHKILFATDFSPYSNQAYLHAVALAENYQAALTIVHVHTPSGPMPLGAEAGMPVLSPAADAREELAYWRGQLEQIRPLNPAIPVKHVLLTGEPADEILAYAAGARADLIVLGTHGRTGLERLLMGSVAERVLHKSSCSVLVVKMPKPLPAAKAALPEEAALTPA
jgi:nucleotide-binding universal stress UspA family protein